MSLTLVRCQTCARAMVAARGSEDCADTPAPAVITTHASKAPASLVITK
jgi:hypothetical protein